MGIEALALELIPSGKRAAKGIRKQESRSRRSSARVAFERVFMHFDDLKLADVVLRAVHAEGYEVPTPIQQKAIPHVLAGQDLLGCAQTGTGKTAAFALPILSRLSAADAPARAGASAHPIRVLVLTPTRELAVQIAESFTTYGKFTNLRVGLIFGGVSQGSQERMLRNGVDIVVATPGRLMDMMNQRLVHLQSIEVFVLDEADRMLDMGFIADIRKIITRLPAQRQNLMFSATMPPEIKRLADGILQRPVHVAVAPIASTAERVEQSVYHLERRAKPTLLLHLLDSDRSITRVLIFTRTKHGADRLAKGLDKHGIAAEAIHGNKSQNQRQRALDTFKQGQNRVLVATDIAARGLDIDLVSHVINYELPNIPESYVHRIGRTARAGESGIAISFCDPEEREFLRDIERLIGRKVPVAVNPSSIGAAEKTFGQERDSDRRALHGSGGGRGQGGGRDRSGGHRGPERSTHAPADAGRRPAPHAAARPPQRAAAPSAAPRHAGPARPPARGHSEAPAPSYRNERPDHSDRSARPERADRGDRAEYGASRTSGFSSPPPPRYANPPAGRGPAPRPDRGEAHRSSAPAPRGPWRGESAPAGRNDSTGYRDNRGSSGSSGPARSGGDAGSRSPRPPAGGDFRRGSSGGGGGYAGSDRPSRPGSPPSNRGDQRHR